MSTCLAGLDEQSETGFITFGIGIRPPYRLPEPGHSPKTAFGPEPLSTTKRNYRLLKSSPQSGHPFELRCQLDGGPDYRASSQLSAATAGL